MAKITDKLLGYIATTAEDVSLEAMGLASHGGMHEPEMPEEVKAYKANHTSKIETLFDKLVK